MEHSIAQISHISLLMAVSIAFSMDKPYQSVITDNNSWCSMVADHDSGAIIVQQLSPQEINVLRKTSLKLNQFFSFYNPSLKFLQCNNQYIHPKDYKNVFFVSLYDGYYDKAELLMHHEQARIAACKNNGDHKLCKDRINNSYKIPGAGQALYPCMVAQKSHHKEMPILLKNYLETTVVNGSFLTVEPHDLLIACISRNSERVEKIVMNNEFDTILNKDTILLGALNIAISGDDIQTIRLLLINNNFRKYSNASLIWQTILCGSYPSCEFLIKSNICDINEKITSIVKSGTEGFTLMMQELIGSLESTSTLLDLFQENKKLLEIKYGTRFIGRVEMVLLQNGAKTLEFLQAEEKTHIPPTKSVFKKMLNKVRK